MNNGRIKKISSAIFEYVEARDRQKECNAKLRQIAVDECGFDQEMVNKCSPADLLDGYVKGFLYQKGGAA